MRLCVPLALVVGLAGCGGYIGSGPPPRLAAQQPLKVDVVVTGAERPTAERALDWVLSGAHQITRTADGADARLEVAGSLKEQHLMLGGTDCHWHVALTVTRPGSTPVHAEQELVAEGLTSNLAVEREKLITRGMVWALDQAAMQLAAPPPPVEPPAVETPTPEAAPAEPQPTPEPESQPAPVRRRRRHRRRHGD